MIPSTNQPAIVVEGLGKRFRVGRFSKRHNTLRDTIAGAAASGARLARSMAGRRSEPEVEDFMWALRDVDLTVSRGEAVGIVGPNGAGKSTLLKILSRITEPTEGRAEIRGRVGSLLEVGTGFHSELTGRENTYLSGAILGMRRAEIDRKFDEIVAFADVDRFIDTPVKHYSSGMSLRLAFAVAAHLEPEILIIDEVLAVGDAEFQKKCLGKMEEVTHREGRTVFFVSHNMSAVQTLCDRCVLLRKGRVEASGPPMEVIRSYLAGGISASLPETWIDLGPKVHRGQGGCRFLALRYSGGDVEAAYSPVSGGPLKLRLVVQADAAMEVGSLSFRLRDLGGTRLVNADTRSIGQVLHLPAGRNEVEFSVDSLHLNPGLYKLDLWLANRAGIVLDEVWTAADMEIVLPPGESRRITKEDGLVTCDFRVRPVA
jgi:lipopolysaccharide transport system ATP-binding protein